MSRVLLNYNEKGGVGKTTLTGMQSYILSSRGKKVLNIDLDPQHNLTNMVEYTYRDGKRLHPIAKLENALEDNDLRSAICHVTKNLDIAPSSLSLLKFQDWDNAIGKPTRFKIVKEAIKPIRDNYDYIFLDVPPTFNPFSFNALYAADNLNLVVQTQRSSYTSALDTISLINTLKEHYNFGVIFTGVILYLIIKRAKVDKLTARRAIKTFGKFVYHNRIVYQERVKGFTDAGISDHDFWDKKAIGMYSLLNGEIMKRIKETE